MVSRLFSFYYQGFVSMPVWAKTLWLIILVKLFIMFFVLKLFFFRDTLKNKYSTTEEKANHVIEQITKSKLNDGTH